MPDLVLVLVLRYVVCTVCGFLATAAMYFLSERSLLPTWCLQLYDLSSSLLTLRQRNEGFVHGVGHDHGRAAGDQPRW